ncbi:hypothetical protein BC827DRAFT_1159663 [Russula dissimulans]|nr:hypothetical protein BC827DRAFT_1159663 [Russula dissimulans]
MNSDNVSLEPPTHTLSNETQAFLVALNHLDNGLQTFQVQDTHFVHVPSQFVTPLPSPNPVAQAAPAHTHPHTIIARFYVARGEVVVPKTSGHTETTCTRSTVQFLRGSRAKYITRKGSLLGSFMAH